MKYVGVTLDQWLSFRARVSKCLQCPCSINAKLFHFFPIVGQCQCTLNSQYICFLRAETFQYWIPRYNSNSPWFVHNYAVERGLQDLSLDRFVCSLMHRLFNHASTSPYPHLCHLSTGESPPPRKLKKLLSPAQWPTLSSLQSIQPTSQNFTSQHSCQHFVDAEHGNRWLGSCAHLYSCLLYTSRCV